MRRGKGDDQQSTDAPRRDSLLATSPEADRWLFYENVTRVSLRFQIDSFSDAIAKKHVQRGRVS